MFIVIVHTENSTMDCVPGLDVVLLAGAGAAAAGFDAAAVGDFDF